jgi:NADP-dependent 3-hydroxy acid dehydrogenase YdfG
VLVSKGFRVFGSVRKQTDADRLQKEFGNGFVPLLMDITDADAVHQATRKVGSIILGMRWGAHKERRQRVEQEKECR